MGEGRERTIEGEEGRGSEKRKIGSDRGKDRRRVRGKDRGRVREREERDGKSRKD